MTQESRVAINTRPGLAVDVAGGAGRMANAPVGLMKSNINVVLCIRMIKVVFVRLRLKYILIYIRPSIKM